MQQSLNIFEQNRLKTEKCNEETLHEELARLRAKVQVMETEIKLLRRKYGGGLNNV
jgi:cell division protein FtsB